MADYKTDQDWLMDELAARQSELEKQEADADFESFISQIDDETKRCIAGIMKGIQKFSKLKAEERYAYWKRAYRAKSPGALIVFKRATEMRGTDL